MDTGLPVFMRTESVLVTNNGQNRQKCAKVVGKMDGQGQPKGYWNELTTRENGIGWGSPSSFFLLQENRFVNASPKKDNIVNIGRIRQTSSLSIFLRHSHLHPHPRWLLCIAELLKFPNSALILKSKKRSELCAKTKKPQRNQLRNQRLPLDHKSPSA